VKFGISLPAYDQALAALAILALIFFLGTSAVRAAPAPPPVPREVLTFYYGWWGTPKTSGSWTHWSGVQPAAKIIANSAHYPRGGAYDSHDPATIDRHLDQMKAAGVTGLISSWWGRGTFDDKSLDLVMAQAPTRNLKVSAYYEQVPNLGPNARPGAVAEAVVADLNYLLDRHAAKPGWLTVHGRPVIFLFRRSVMQLGVDGWWAVARQMARRTPAPILIGDVDLDAPVTTIPVTFSGIHVYNNSDLTVGKSAEMLRSWAAKAYPRWTSKWRSMLTCLTIMPGFGNARATGLPISQQITDRNGGETYAVLADEAIRAKPDWLLITSWNEWHEGSEIEPSVEDGDRALRQTRVIADRFLKLPPRSLKLR
jgi:hypothetical protein